MDNFYVYCWTNKNNGKRYVGKGQGDRAWVHVQHSKSNKPRSLIARAIKKHGIENFELTFLVADIPEEHALAWEKGYIDLYKTNISREYEPGVYGHGYNMTDGGDGVSGHRHTDETKRKISEKCGSKQPEARRKIAEANRRSMTPERKAKIGETHRGRKRSPETGRKISEKLKGNKNGVGAVHKKKLTDEQKATIRARRAEGATFQQLKDEFGPLYNVSTMTIHRACAAV